MALGRPQIVATDNGFTFWGDRPSNTAAVASNRLSRDTRLGRVAVSNAPDADAHRGFGPFPPLVVGEAFRFSGPKVIKPYARNAAQQRWTQRRPKSFYTEAVVIGQGIAFGGPAVLRTRIRPAPIHSKLRPPVVVNPFVPTETFSGPSVTLAPAPKPRTRSRLFPPTVLATPDVFSGPDTHLAPSRRGTPKSILRPPVAPETFPGLATTLAPSRRPVTKSRLGPMGGPAILYAPLTVKLARIRPVPTRSFLRRPTDLVDAQDIGLVSVTLAYSVRGKPRSILRPPTVVVPPPSPPVETTLSVNLTYSRRGKPLSGLGRPIVLHANTAFPQGPMVSLAPQRRGKPKSSLKRPTVLRAAAVLTPITVTLARIRPPRTHWRLHQIVYPAKVYAPISVNLTYSRRGRPVYWLKLTETTIAICFGTVTGFDFAPTVCGDDEGLTVEGFDVGADVCGDDEGPTVGGASAPGGSVTGGDARREGC